MSPGATAARAARPAAFERLAALPAWMYVGALFLASTVIRFAFAAAHPAPFIFTDELLYGELAKSFAATGHFALREVPGTAGFGIVYPILISPAYAIFGAVPHAYTLIKLINAVLMSLTAVPTYLLARRLVDRWLALVAVVLTLALPSLLYAGNVMTENAFFPAFTFWCWATVTALERPTVRRQLLALVLLALCYFTRPQAAVLVGALVAAIALVILLDVLAAPGRRWPAVRTGVLTFLPTWIALAVAAALFLGLEVGVRGKSFGAATLGSYSVLTGIHYTVSGVGRWFVYHLGELDLSLALIPFAALLALVLIGLRPRQPRELRVFAAFSLVVSIFLLTEVAAFASTGYGLRIQERNMFYLDPLFLIGLVACVQWALPWTYRGAAAVGAIVAAALPGAVPFANFLGSHAVTDAFSLTNLMSILDRHIVALPQLQGAVMFGAIVAAAIFVLTPRRYALLLPAVTLVALSFMNGPPNRRTTQAAKDSRTGGVQTRRNWIDLAVGTKPDVTALWSGRAAYVTLWDNEFFNRSVGKVYNFFGPPDGLPQQTVALDSQTGEVELDNHPVHARYVLADPTLVLRAGKPVARDKGLGMTVYRVDGPIKVAGQLEGVYPDLWSGPTATYTELACKGGTVTVRLTSDPGSHPFPQTITAKEGGRVFSKTVRPRHFYVPFSVPVRPVKGVCRVDYTISPTAIPDQRLHNGDTRELGIRFVRVVYTPPGGAPTVNR
jgi:hypothetical protein